MNIISRDVPDTAPKSGFQKILDFFNELEVNRPVAIKEVVDKTGISWTYVKRVLSKQLKEDYSGFHFKKSGNTWIAWKDRKHLIKKMDDTCGRFLK